MLNFNYRTHVTYFDKIGPLLLYFHSLKTKTEKESKEKKYAIKFLLENKIYRKIFLTYFFQNKEIDQSAREKLLRSACTAGETELVSLLIKGEGYFGEGNFDGWETTITPQKMFHLLISDISTLVLSIAQKKYFDIVAIFVENDAIRARINDDDIQAIINIATQNNRGGIVNRLKDTLEGRHPSSYCNIQ